jgi:hypothetical protein
MIDMARQLGFQVVSTEGDPAVLQVTLLLRGAKADQAPPL